MKVVFLYPYYDEKVRIKDRVEFPPLGMLHVCSAIRAAGHEVEVLTVYSGADYESYPQADIYCYAITASVVYPIFLEAIKVLRGNAKYHIAGNNQANNFPHDVYLEMGLDAIFVGEGEEVVPEWINSGCKQKGVIRGGMVDINEIPFPARELLPDDRIYMGSRLGGKVDNIISMVSSRGCPFPCKFCAIMNRGKPRYRTPESFEAELVEILEKYPKCQGITLLDETFTMRHKHVEAIAQVLDKYGLYWECNSRANTLRDDIINVLANSNCMEVKIGIETGSQELANNMAKGNKLEKSKEAIIKAHTAGIPLKFYMMHGYPGENLATTHETIEFLKSMKGYIHRLGIFRFVPLPGSPVFNEGKCRKRDWNDYTIYDNPHHWWGTEDDFAEMNKAWDIFSKFVGENFKV